MNTINRQLAFYLMCCLFLFIIISCKNREEINTRIKIAPQVPKKVVVYDFPFTDVVDAGDLKCDHKTKDLIDDKLESLVKRFTDPLNYAQVEFLKQEIIKHHRSTDLLIESGDQYDRINTIKDKMTPYISDKSMVHEIFVYDAYYINAFTVFGGAIFVTKGLLNEVTDDNILAGIIGHEIGHGQGNHLEGYARLAYALLTISEEEDPTLWSLARAVGIIGAASLYKKIDTYTSQSNEIEADIAGAYLTYKAGYNPEVISSFWKGKAKKESVSSSFWGKAKQSLFKTHPFAEDRAACLSYYCKFHRSDLTTFKSYEFVKKAASVYESDDLILYEHPYEKSRVVAKYPYTDTLDAHGTFVRELVDEDGKNKWIFVSSTSASGWVIDDYSMLSD